MLPSQRTIQKLKKEGWLVASVEKYNSFIHQRFDLYGFIDILAIKGKETLAIQATSTGNINARIEKIKASPNYEIVKRAGWRIEVYGWSKKGAKGKRKLWEVKIIKL